ncbi:protein NPG1-like [Impatiens glandulifera]|uniref:protein NPG1-like n=1 Tax=Impatiens glandulifera TaxID=253017 RepID=UPI001FB0AE9C|nr:protein NPG1-like [Impatiens glandulifera]XP_047330615.1 protein NPG1-like [Impatiens glandulifera]
MAGNETADMSEHDDSTGVREVCANGLSMNTFEVEAKLDEGNVQEAESSLQEGLSLNSEEARALLGRLEYQRGNVEAALRVFEGIDLQVAIERLQSLAEKTAVKKRSRTESIQNIPQHAASLVLEGVYLKAKSLQKLGRLTEAAQECKNVLDGVEKIFCNGIPEMMVDSRLQETVSRAAELLPELWKQAGCFQEVMSAYRSALLNQWNLDNDCCARIQKEFAVFLLYSGVEVGPPSLSVQIDGSYVPRNNLEEAVLLLMILMKNIYLGKVKWDPSVLEHLKFALSVCGQTCALAKHLEEVMPGILSRNDRWKEMALCYSGGGEDKVALNLLRKTLVHNEKPNDFTALLLAAKICSEDPSLAAEGVEYAQRAISNAHDGIHEHLKGVCLRLLGLCYGQQAKVSSSDYERSRLQSEALKSLDSAISLECNNFDLIFDLGVQYAKHRNLDAAMVYANKYINVTGGSLLRGWRLLALILSAEQRFSEAEVVIDAALDETANWEQGSLLRMKAKLKLSRSLHTDAVETYKYLLALAQAQKNYSGPLRTSIQAEDDDKVNEFQVWHGLANLYSSLSHWKDAEICLDKARGLIEYSAETLHTEGIIYEGQGDTRNAMAAYISALLLDPEYVPCKILIGSIMAKVTPKGLPVARSLLSDALRIEPTNRMAWYYLGLVHRDDGRLADAMDCFQAASMLEESNPIESFGSVF